MFLACKHFINPFNIVFGFFDVKNPFNPVGDGIHRLGNAAAAQRQYGLQLLHNLNIIKTVAALLCIPHIFQVAQLVLLPVQIIRMLSLCF